MKTVVIIGVNKLGHKVHETVSITATESAPVVARDKLGFTKVSAVMTESAFNKTKELEWNP